MKYKVVLTLIFSLLASSSHAATSAKMLGLKATTMISLSGDVNDQVSAVLAIPTALIIIGTSGKNGFITAYDRTGSSQQWSLTLGVDSIATAATKDSKGDIWVLGASSIQDPAPTASPIPPGTLNPAGIVPETSTALPILKSLSLWKVSSKGTLLKSYSLMMADAILPRAIEVKAGKVTVTGSIASQPRDIFTVSLGSSEEFSAVKISSAPRMLPTPKEVKTTLSIWRSFTTSTAIKGIPTWKPKPNSHVLVRYDAKNKSVIAGYLTSGEILDFVWEKSIGIISLIEYPTNYGLAIIK